MAWTDSIPIPCQEQRADVQEMLGFNPANIAPDMVSICVKIGLELHADTQMLWPIHRTCLVFCNLNNARKLDRTQQT